MPKYEVYATRWDDPHIVDELVPATGLSFNFPLNDHGEATFTATVEPGRTFWRQSIALPLSGILITRDGIPYWDGVVVSEQPAGPRSFSFTAKEWGWFLEEKVKPTPRQWATPTNDHLIVRQLIDDAQANGYPLGIDTGSTLGASESIKTDVTAWAKTTVGKELRKIADARGGPDWYIGISGSLDNPRRKLYLADRHGHVDPQAVLEYVEDTEPVEDERRRPVVALLGDLFPGPGPMVPVRRAGGNVIAQGRSRSLAAAATEVIGFGAGQERAQLRRTAKAYTLLSRGWPLMTSFFDDTSVTSGDTLTRNAVAQLSTMAGIATGYSLVTLDGDEASSADWTQTPRGSNVRVILDTDIYGADRPVGGPDGFVARCLDTVVRVPDSGVAQVEWKIADVLEVA